MTQDTARTMVSDAELVRRAQNRESGAFDALFDRHYARVFNFALNLTGDGDSAGDIAQSAFVKTYDALNRVRDGQAILKFLYRAVVNLVRDRARSRERKPWTLFTDLLRPGDDGNGSTDLLDTADPGLDPQRLLIAKDRDEALRSAIAGLPGEFREALVLHHLEGMDVREISEVIGVPAGTVKSRLGRARARLRTALAEWLDGDGEPQ